MKLSPFSVSFDGPLDRGERRRASILAVALCGVIIFLFSGGLPTLLNAGSGFLAAWTNARPEIGTTGVGSLDEPTKPEVTTKSVLEARAAVRAEAVIAKPKPDSRASDNTAGVKATQRRQPQKLPQARKTARVPDDAAVELRWRERAAEIERRAPRDNFFR
jgi:hypothetical protein